MSQEFKQRINLTPDSFQNIESSYKKKKTIDINDEADLDTFYRSDVCKETPKKSKHFNPIILQTPKISKSKLRKISFRSPLSFYNEDSDTFVRYTDIREMNNISPNLDFSQRRVTNFTPNNYNDRDNEIFNFNTCFSKNKKNSNTKNKNNEKFIVFNNRNGEKCFYPLFNDSEIFGNNNLDKENFYSNSDSDDDSDNEKIKYEKKICIEQLNQAINHYSKNKSSFFNACA